MNSIDRLLLRPREAAEAIGLARSTTYALIRSGEIPSIIIGRSVRISVASLRKWIEARGVRSKQPSGPQAESPSKTEKRQTGAGASADADDIPGGSPPIGGAACDED